MIIGRPTIYSEELLEKSVHYLANFEELGDEIPSNVGLALYLGVHRDTIQVWGGQLKKGEIVHHIDEDSLNNDPFNLMVLPNNAAHRFIHMILKAKKESGDPNKRPCKFCTVYDKQENLRKYGSGRYHLKCENQYRRKRREHAA